LNLLLHYFPLNSAKVCKILAATAGEGAPFSSNVSSAYGVRPAKSPIWTE
jgi:hypothetical protein